MEKAAAIGNTRQLYRLIKETGINKCKSDYFGKRRHPHLLLKAAFDSVDREILWQCLSLKGVPQKYINLVKALYSNTTNRVRAYGEPSSAFATSSGVRQGCPLSPFLFNFIIDLLMEITFSSTEFSGIDLLPGSLIDLEYADDIVLFGEDADKMQSFGSTEQQCHYVWNALLSL
ncbi:unnamed protein product [Schistosoma haematobium]|nr:unnamed protein product [Schistosoma haematobium]